MKLLPLTKDSIISLCFLHCNHLLVVTKEGQLTESSCHTISIAVDHTVDSFPSVESLYLQTTEKHLRTQNYFLPLST